MSESDPTANTPSSAALPSHQASAARTEREGMPSHDGQSDEQRNEQRDVLLLAQARRVLLRASKRLRVAHLYPQGPNEALLIAAYQDFTRLRDIRYSGQPQSIRWQKKQLQRCLLSHLRRDALLRSFHLRFHLPAARIRPSGDALGDLVDLALQAVHEQAPPPIKTEQVHTQDTNLPASAYVDDPLRAEIAKLLRGEWSTKYAPDSAESWRWPWSNARIDRGLRRFRRALIEAALQHPHAALRLSPQVLHLANVPPPRRMGRPLANYFLVRLPLQVLGVALFLFTSVYSSAYIWFNDEVLGSFLTDLIGAGLDGELSFEKVHWSPRLVLDLVTGHPSRVEVYGVRVYEAFKRTNSSQRRETAYAEHLSADIVLHEIIPWNRLGLPAVFDVPWVLHFSHVESSGRMWAGARQYVDPDSGATKISLTDAFAAPDDSPPTYGYKRLSFRVDQTAFHDIDVPLDFTGNGGWGVNLRFGLLDLALQNNGDYPEAPKPAEMPFYYRVNGQDVAGKIFAIGQILPLEDVKELTLESGWRSSPMGELYLYTEGKLGGSPVVLEGALTNTFGEIPGVDFQIQTANAGPLVNHFAPPDPETHISLIEVKGPAAVHVGGPLKDPDIEIAAQGVDLNFGGDPSWKLTRADARVRLRHEHVPRRWHEALGPNAQAWVFHFEHLYGNVLGGQVGLDPQHEDPHLVWPAPGFSFRTSFGLDLRDIDPGLLVATNPSLASKLSGQAKSRLGVNQLVFGPTEEGAAVVAEPAKGHAPGFWPTSTSAPDVVASAAETSETTERSMQLVNVTIHETRLARRATRDHLPPELTLGGSMQWTAKEGLNINGMVVRTQGATLDYNGGFDPTFSRFKPTNVRFEVDDGAAFFSALDLPVNAPRLLVELQFSGPLAAPHGEEGRFSAPSIEASNLRVTGLDQVKLWLANGALHLRGPQTELFGGKGPLEFDLVFGEKNRFLDQPKIRLSMELANLNAMQLAGLPLDIRNASLAVVVADERGKAVAIDKINARGRAHVPDLEVAGVSYASARAEFALSPDEITLHDLHLSYERPLSPTKAPQVRATLGSLHIDGRVGFAKDPELDLNVHSNDLPLRALTNFIDPNLIVRGRLASGSQLHVGGSVSRPDINGKVELRGIAVADLGLGSGRLDFTSSEKALPSHGGMRVRHIAVNGQLSHPQHRDATVVMDAEVALGSESGKEVAIQAKVDANVERIPLARLLAHPGNERWSTALDGVLSGLRVHATYCPGALGLIDVCTAGPKPASSATADALALEVAMDQVWIGPRAANAIDLGAVASNQACPAQATLCSQTPLNANLDGSQLVLREPWILATGAPGRVKHQLQVVGTFDFGEEPGTSATNAPVACDAAQALQPGAVADNDRNVQSAGRHAKVTGELNLQGLAPLLLPVGVDNPKGILAADVSIDGKLSNPALHGRLRLQPEQGPVGWSLAAGGMTAGAVDLALPSLDIDLRGTVAELAGELKLANETIRFGQDERPSAIAFAGLCQGQYRLALLAPSSIDGKLLQQLAPTAIAQSSGAVGIDHLVAAGNLKAPLGRGFFDTLEGRLSFGRRALRLTVDRYEFNLNGGVIDLRRCEENRPCGSARRGVGLFVGGEQGSGANARPKQALSASVAGRNESGLGLWGRVLLGDDFRSLQNADLRASLRMFPFRLDDNSGQPELSAALNSELVELTIDHNGSKRVSGDLLVERSRWLRDITQGISVLSFADPTPAPPSSVPDALADIVLDVSMRTTAPFRVDNNILHGLEAQAQLHLGGTLDHVELTGQIDVNRGQLDLALLGGAYTIERGRVNLNREFDRSTVELLATRKDMVRVDNELHRVSLALSGSLAAIQWRCSSTATRGRALNTAGGCIDYLIFDTGNAALAQQEDSTRNPALPRLSRPLTLVGNLTQKELNEYVQARAPEIEQYLPKMRVRMGQLGVEAQANTRPEWLAWRWGTLTFGVGYLRGYPSGLLRNSQSFSLRMGVLENLALEYSNGNRNYTNRAFVLDPPSFQALEFIHVFRIPSVR